VDQPACDVKNEACKPEQKQYSDNRPDHDTLPVSIPFWDNSVWLGSFRAAADWRNADPETFIETFTRNR
jgi:hypothetical protein